MTAHPEVSRSKQPLEWTKTNGLTTAELFDLLGDKYTHRVYEAVVERPRCDRDVAGAADVSRSTTYRHFNAPHDTGLIRTEISIYEDEHHRERFETVPASSSVSLNENDTDAMVSVSS